MHNRNAFNVYSTIFVLVYTIYTEFSWKSYIYSEAAWTTHQVKLGLQAGGQVKGMWESWLLLIENMDGKS